jgi:hypothetical protein
MSSSKRKRAVADDDVLAVLGQRNRFIEFFFSQSLLF